MHTAVFVCNDFPAHIDTDTCCPIPFNKLIPCLLDVQNRDVVTTDKLKVPEEEQSSVTPEMRPVCSDNQRSLGCSALDAQPVDQRRKLHLPV